MHMTTFPSGSGSVNWYCCFLYFKAEELGAGNTTLLAHPHPDGRRQSWGWDPGSLSPAAEFANPFGIFSLSIGYWLESYHESRLGLNCGDLESKV